MNLIDLAEIRQRNALLRAQSVEAAKAFMAAADGHAQALRESAVVIDMSKSRQLSVAWGVLLGKARVYQKWCDSGRIDNRTAQAMLADDARDAGFDIHPALVMQWQKAHADMQGGGPPSRSDRVPTWVRRQLELQNEPDSPV
jgi:hypothetical protein